MLLNYYTRLGDFIFLGILILLLSPLNNTKIKKEPLGHILNLSSNGKDNSSKVNSTEIKNLPDNKSSDSEKEEMSNFEYFKNFILQITHLGNNNSRNNTDMNNLRKEKGFSAFVKSSELYIFSNDRKLANTDLCSNDSCGETYGYCISKKQCKCNYSYINVPNSKKLCDYKLSSQLTALILEMLLPFGFGHFYCKRILIGITKFLILFFIPTLLAFIFKTYLLKDENGLVAKAVPNNTKNWLFNGDYKELIKKISLFIYLVLFFIWYLFDFIIFSNNKHKDGSGYDLIPFNSQYRF